MITHKQLIELGFTKVTRKRWYKDCLHGSILIDNGFISAPNFEKRYLDSFWYWGLKCLVDKSNKPICVYPEPETINHTDGSWELKMWIAAPPIISINESHVYTFAIVP